MARMVPSPQEQEPGLIDRRNFLLGAGAFVGATALGGNLTARATEEDLEIRASQESNPESRIVGRTERIAGTERMDTARRISQKWYPNNYGALGAVLATKGKFPNTLNSSPDAIISAPVATGGMMPILLNPVEQLTPENRAELSRVVGENKSREIVIPGGSGAISYQIEHELKTVMLFDVSRCEDVDRYTTAAKFAGSHFGEYSQSRYAFLASGRDGDFADAMVASVAGSMSWRPDLSPETYNNRGPVILSDGPYLPEATKRYIDAKLNQIPSFKIYAIGSLAAQAYPTNYKTLTGSPAEMSVQVAKEFTDPSNSAELTVGIATYRKCWDGLGATSFTIGGHPNGRMLYIHGDFLDPAVEKYLSDNRSQIDKTWIFGGDAVVSNQVQDQIANIIKT